MEYKPTTPREAWERYQNGEETTTGSRAGYKIARDTLLHNSTLLIRERCLVKNDISGWNDNPWWVRVTMRDGELTDNAQTIMEAMRNDAHHTEMESNDDGTVSVTFYYHCLEEKEE